MDHELERERERAAELAAADAAADEEREAHYEREALRHFGYQIRLQFVIASMTGFFAVAALVVGYFREDISLAIGVKPFGFLLPLVLASMTSGSWLLYRYLRGWVSRGMLDMIRKGNEIRLPKTSSANLTALSQRLDTLEKASAPTFSGSTPGEIAQVLLPSVRGELARVFEDQYERKSEQALSASANAKRFDAAVRRLETEIKEQSRKGNVNLIIGVVTTLLAVGLLAWIVLGATQENLSWTKENPTWTQLAAHYIPRLSLIVFIEVFSFFFLRLYKATLEEARRYNDDLTRLTLQWVATETGRFAEEPGAIFALAKELLNVSKPPKLASAEASKPPFDSDKVIKAGMDAMAKQLGKTKKEGKEEAADKDD